MRQTHGTIIQATRLGGTLLAAALLGAGCNLRPAPPKTYSGRKVTVVAVNPTDKAEIKGVEALHEATARYRQNLGVLQAYYIKVGSYDKEKWTKLELKNLDNARTWQYEGVPEPAPTQGLSVEGVTEAALVEQVIAWRQQWKQSLLTLGKHYRLGGMDFKYALIANVLRRHDPVREYDYFLNAEIPPATLRPTEVVPAADALFDQARKLHRRGKPLPGITIYSKQRRAVGMFRKLINQYPTSTKIAESAYYIGEIYKEYFDEDIRAVHWYERAWQWKPNIQLPARSQAAFVYDIRMGHYGKALHLYHEVLKHETFSPNRIRYAYQRIEELNAKRK